jgi:uncharacterized membrane protein
VSLYEWLVVIHVVMAVVWVGGGAVLNILAIRTQRANDPDRLYALARDVEWVGTRVFIPASIVLLIAGIWAAAEGNWEFSQAWISIGFMGYIISFLAGILYFGPESGRIAKLVAAEGAASATVQARLSRLLVFTRIELVILIVVIAAMVAKPGL